LDLIGLFDDYYATFQAYFHSKYTQIMNFRPIQSVGLCALLALAYIGCGRNESPQEQFDVPSKGLITTVVEVEPNSFKIEEELPIEDTASSLIIAKYMSGKVDTFSLAEARQAQQSNGTYHSPHHSVFSSASYGMMGFMLGRSLMTPPMSSAYRDERTYNRINSTTGAVLRNTAHRVTRPGSGSSSGSSRSRSGSGFGSGRSGRGGGG
jgi:hypothetical protein